MKPSLKASLMRPQTCMSTNSATVLFWDRLQKAGQVPQLEADQGKYGWCRLDICQKNYTTAIFGQDVLHQKT